MSDSAPGYQLIYRLVRRIPRGKVATYGQIAVLAGIPRQPRQVGYALYALPGGSNVPWQRVINAKGEVSQRSTPGYEGMQRVALESEGVVFDPGGRVDLGRYQWRPVERRRFS